MRQTLTLITLLTLSGCFNSHGLEGSAPMDASMPDDGMSGRDTRPATQECFCCGGTVVTWPADIGCEFGACDGSCLSRCESATVEVLEVSVRNDGSPWQIGVPNDRCACESEIRCEANVIDDHIVQLSAERCGVPDTDFCECEPWTFAQCEMPPLEEGMWRVVQPDRLDAFGPVQVAPENYFIERVPPRWQSPTVDSVRHEQMRWPPTPSSSPSREVCFTPNEDGTFSAEVEVCGSCAHSVLGACSMAIEGESLSFWASAQSPITTSDVVCEGCVWRSRSCGRPVEPGSYQVVVDGVERGEVMLGDESVCFPGSE